MSKLPELPERFAQWKEDDDDCGAWGSQACDVFTANQMRAYAEQAIASVKREPLSEEQIASIYATWDRTLGASFADLFRAIEAAHGIGGGENDHDGPESGASTETTMVVKAQEDLPSALPIPAPELKWLPIEEVPDGQLVLFCNMDASVEMRNAFFVDWMVDGESCSTKVPRKATHYMPLPPAPSTEES